VPEIAAFGGRGGQIDLPEDDLTVLKHVRSRAEIKAAEEIANRRL
jgi:hypothetical protein